MYIYIPCICHVHYVHVCSFQSSSSFPIAKLSFSEADNSTYERKGGGEKRPTKSSQIINESLDSTFK